MTPTKQPVLARSLVLIPVLALAGAVVACGDDGGETGDGGTVIETDRDTEALVDDDGDGEAASPEDLGIELSDCAQAIGAVGQAYASLVSPGEMDGGIADLESLVPAEFESDVSVLADAIGEMQSAFDSAGAESGDPDATRAVVEDNRDILDAAEEAMENIEHHFKASCE